MPIGFARIEFVKRSAGKTVCAKAAYNARSKMEFDGNCALDPKTYDWSWKEKTAFHDILLPKGASENFKIAQVLWNAVEKKEIRSNAQVAMELVLALPDDKVVTVEDRIELTCRFIQAQFVDKGVTAQIDIHPPERKVLITQDYQEIGLFKGMTGEVIEEKGDFISLRMDMDDGKVISFNATKFKGFVEKEHNWHAHVLVSTRRFKSNGLEFADSKARDLVPQVMKGKVVSGLDWGKLWAAFQNQFFEEKGILLCVDPNGIVPQEHLGPIRLRARAFELLEEHGRRLEDNTIKAEDPTKILDKITEKQSVFTKEDVDRFLQKHCSAPRLEKVRQEFWKQEGCIQLVDKKTGEVLEKFTSLKTIEEEKKILRLADRIQEGKIFKIDEQKARKFSHTLNEEQKGAFEEILNGKRLICVQGYAGTGKSHLLSAVREAYEHEGYQVRAFGPDSATADVLKKKGFHGAENVYSFLFGLHHGKRTVSGKEIWVFDEAGKLGNVPFLEFLKQAEKRGVRIILSGDAAQLPSVGRGGMFKVLCERYGSVVLEDIQRQKAEKHRDIVKNLATGAMGAALDKFAALGGVKWATDRKEAMEQLMIHWAVATKLEPRSSTLLIAHSNDEVRLLNELARGVRKERGELDSKEFCCETTFGKIYISIGDQIEFRKNDHEIGVSNGLTGTLIKAQPDRFVVSVQESEKRTKVVTFNPQEYHAFQLGYAGTYYRVQGRTVDRAYVLHSPYLNKEKFYVALSRHVKSVFYFVPETEVYCLADLKRQAIRESGKETSLSYTTMMDIHKEQEVKQKHEVVEKLKDSRAFLDQVKGYGIASWNRITTTISGVTGRIQDRTPDRAFFHPSLPETRKNRPVSIVSPMEFLSSREMIQAIRFNEAELHQALKGLQEEKKPLSQLQLLKEMPSASVLIVEGGMVEALTKLQKKDLICVAAPDTKDVSRTDWSILSRRDVVIWPGNGSASHETAQQMCHELKRVGVRSLGVVDPRNLSDPVPSHPDGQFLERLLHSTVDKGIDPRQLSLNVSSLNEKDPIGMARANEVLWRVDERLRPALEEKYGVQSWKIKEEILKESAGILLREEEGKDFLKKNFGVDGKILDRLSYQTMLHKAAYGMNPAIGSIETMKQVIRNFGHIGSFKDVDGAVKDLAVDKTLTIACCRELLGSGLKKSEVDGLRKEIFPMAQDLSRQMGRQSFVEKSVFEKQKSMGKGLDVNF